ncbi:MAG: hypothetical protein LBT91_02585 [Bifidobacteriaceae bacterium]|jgi:hypothetical protein|nr:hypothetical protein [Bifidobacteriaceae bacterium]
MLTQELLDNELRHLYKKPAENAIGHSWDCTCNVCCDVIINNYSKNDIQIIDNKVRELELFRNIKIPKNITYEEKIERIKHIETKVENKINEDNKIKLNFKKL